MNGTVASIDIAHGAVGTAQIENGAVDATKLSASFLGDLVTEAELSQLQSELDGDGIDTTPNDNDDLVSFNEIRDLTSSGGNGRITGTFIEDGTITATDLGGGSVESAEIRDGTIGAVDLAGEYTDHDNNSSTPPVQSIAGAVTSAKIFDGTIEARDLGSGAVTSDKVADGSIDTTKLKAHATTGSNLGQQLASTMTSVGSTIIDIGSGTHKILLTGLAQATCDNGCLDGAGNTQVVEVRWRVFDVASSSTAPLPVTHDYRLTLTPENPIVMLPVSAVVHAASGTKTYDLRASATSASGGAATATILGVTLSAVDLGRA